MGPSLGDEVDLNLDIVLGVFGPVLLDRVVMTTDPPAYEPGSEGSGLVLNACAGIAQLRPFRPSSDLPPKVAVPLEALELAMAPWGLVAIYPGTLISPDRGQQPSLRLITCLGGWYLV